LLEVGSLNDKLMLMSSSNLIVSVVGTNIILRSNLLTNCTSGSSISILLSLFAGNGAGVVTVSVLAASLDLSAAVDSDAVVDSFVDSVDVSSAFDSAVVEVDVEAVDESAAVVSDLDSEVAVVSVEVGDVASVDVDEVMASAEAVELVEDDEEAGVT
jgi:hypothetical protein